MICMLSMLKQAMISLQGMAEEGLPICVTALLKPYRVPFTLELHERLTKSNECMPTLESRKFLVMGEVSLCIRILPNC